MMSHRTHKRHFQVASCLQMFTQNDIFLIEILHSKKMILKFILIFLNISKECLQYEYFKQQVAS